MRLAFLCGVPVPPLVSEADEVEVVRTGFAIVISAARERVA